MVYLIHFETPLHHAKHYIGWTRNKRTFVKRIEYHRNGHGAKILNACNKMGIDWDVSRVWDDGDTGLEKRLKRWHKSSQLCPVCKGGKNG